jgi:hypothetical protein
VSDAGETSTPAERPGLCADLTPLNLRPWIGALYACALVRAFLFARAVTSPPSRGAQKLRILAGGQVHVTDTQLQKASAICGEGAGATAHEQAKRACSLYEQMFVKENVRAVTGASM